MKTIFFVGIFLCLVFSKVYASGYEYCPHHDHYYYDDYQTYVNYIDEQYDRLNYELEKINHKEALLQRELTRLNEERLHIHREKDRLRHEKEQLYRNDEQQYRSDQLDKYLTDL